MKLYFPLQSKTFALGGSDGIDLRGIPKMYQGRFVHLRRLIFKNAFTPTTTALPTVVQTNNFVANLDFYDGNILRFSGGYNEMRQLERLQNGGLSQPDPDVDTASGTARHWRRELWMGPRQMNGASDFLLPAALLSQAEVRLRWAGALTDFATDCTVAAGTMLPIAECVLLDEIRIPPAYQVSFVDLTAKNYTLPGQRAYTELALLDSSAHGAIAAGDFANLNLDLGEGDLLNGIPADSLSAFFNGDFARGDFDAVAGEPAIAADTGIRAANKTTTTAVQDQAANLQPILWQEPGAKISKLIHTRTQGSLKWSGTQSTGRLIMGALLEQGPQTADSLAVRAVQGVGGSIASAKFKTVSKQVYTGPMKPFMPYKVKVA